MADLNGDATNNGNVPIMTLKRKQQQQQCKKKQKKTMGSICVSI